MVERGKLKENDKIKLNKNYGKTRTIKSWRRFTDVKIIWLGS